MSITADDILLRYEEEISSLGFQLREFLLSELKECVEIPDLSANIIGYGYSTGYKDLICTIIPSKKGIKLGFARGSELPDPGKLLTGSGKVHKFVEINSAKDINSVALKQLVKQAIKAYRERIVAGKK